MRQLTKKEAFERENEPVEFNRWQKQMQDLDDQQRSDMIAQRHRDLDDVRRRAMKVKKERIEEQLELGRRMRIELSSEIAAVQAEIEAERQTIRDLKGQLSGRGAKAVAKVIRGKYEATREFKKEVREELRAEGRRRLAEVEKARQGAEKLREQLRTHTMTRGDKYRAKVEITQTAFLAGLSNEETAELIAKHSGEERNRVEAAIEEHRRLKAQKMDLLVKMLDEITHARDAKEEELTRQKRQKRDERERENLERLAREEEQMLGLQKRLEKKKNERIAEAEEMEEHTRQIAARNRYLALNKKTVATRVFHSQQDAMLRSAKSRQEDKMKPDVGRAPITTTVRWSQEMPHLEKLLGL
jgi:hypothetical protein